MHLALILFLFHFSLHASILPENNMAIPISEKTEGLTEAQYLEIISKAESVYRPILEKMGKRLTINKLWEDPRVNAGTTKKGNEIILNLYGGYPRHQFATPDGYMLVICHEFGHHMGGAPRKIFESGETGWPSTEGQADYFATLKCLRKIFRNDDNSGIVANLEIPGLIREKCSAAFKEEWEKALCMRTTLAGIAVSNISSSIRGAAIASVETPDLTAVEMTFDDHPLPQCRLDTYFQGSICQVSSARSLSDDDETKGTCHRKNLHAEGLRPVCWFKPKE